jgi:hypothetical protein
VGDKGGQYVGQKTLPLSCADCKKSWELQTPGALGACLGLYGDSFTFYTKLWSLHEQGTFIARIDEQYLRINCEYFKTRCNVLNTIFRSCMACLGAGVEQFYEIRLS